MKLKIIKKSKSSTVSIYLPDALLNKARKKGLKNLSTFVREKLEEFVKQPDYNEG
jgi:predicted metal-dependent hydrolase